MSRIFTIAKNEIIPSYGSRSGPRLDSAFFPSRHSSHCTQSSWRLRTVGSCTKPAPILLLTDRAGFQGVPLDSRTSPWDDMNSSGGFLPSVWCSELANSPWSETYPTGELSCSANLRRRRSCVSWCGARASAKSVRSGGFVGLNKHKITTWEG